MLIDSVKSYLTSTVKTPYFLFISDGQYPSVLKDLLFLELDLVPMSSFCSNDDKMPDIDGLLSYIEAADINAKGKKFVVTGLGEFLALRGIEETIRSSGWTVAYIFKSATSQYSGMEINKIGEVFGKSH